MNTLTQKRTMMSTALVLALCIPLASAGADDAPGALRMPFRDLSAARITAEMGTGWNLGNTMDGHTGFLPSETVWQSTETTQALIDAVHDAGFNTIRIPVTWGLKIDDANGYAIDPAWLARVQEIVDYCLRQDVYAIVNIHHDGAEQAGWLRIDTEGDELEAVKEKFARVWEQIAAAFAGYDEHLLFESMNEVTGGDNTEAGIRRDFRVIEELNQIFVDTVRSTGGNNTRRWLVCPGRYTNIANTTDERYGFTMPRDRWNDENRLMLSVHDYDYSFGLVETLGITRWSEQSALRMGTMFRRLIDGFTSRGVPVVLGEYGAVNKNNTEARAYYYEVMNRLSRASGVVPCAWDQGWYDSSLEPDYSFTLFDRATGEPVFEDVVRAILRGYFRVDASDATVDLDSIVRGTPGSGAPAAGFDRIDIETQADGLRLAAGSSAVLTVSAEPRESGDVLVYASSDPAVATVYNGFVRARGIGRAVISARSAAGSVEDTIEVTVYPDTAIDHPAAELAVGGDVYEIAVGESAVIPLSGLSGDSDDTVTFVSSNPAVATVNRLGTIRAHKRGAAYIVITTHSGVSRTLRVEVGEPSFVSDRIELGINVYYNDQEHGFYGFCPGESVTVSGNGTYELTFDSARHLTEAARNTGVSAIENIGAIFIADTARRARALASCDIFYDEVILDGVPLTVTQTEPKSAIKPNTIFDTNDPVNAWDGSAVAEVAVDEYVLNFTGFESPSVITVRFTLSNFVRFGETEPAAEIVPVESIRLEETDGVARIAAVPADTTELVFLASDNPAVVWVSPAARGVDAGGFVTVPIAALGSGRVRLTALSESGKSAEIEMTVSHPIPALEGSAEATLPPIVLEAGRGGAADGDGPNGVSGWVIAITVLGLGGFSAAFALAVRRPRKSR